MNLKKIILSRTDAIGDVILTLPLTAYLKKVFPETEIIFLGKDYTKDIIENCPFVDSFISWDAIEKNAVSEFQKINADAILHIFPKSQIAKAASKAGIPIRVELRIGHTIGTLATALFLSAENALICTRRN